MSYSSRGLGSKGSNEKWEGLQEPQVIKDSDSPSPISQHDILEKNIVITGNMIKKKIDKHLTLATEMVDMVAFFLEWT